MDNATFSSVGVVDLKPKHENLIGIQWEPENCGIGKGRRRYSGTCISCCYKANSCTSNLLNHLLS